MIARVFLMVGLFATATIAFSGTLAETTGVEITEPASAECWDYLGDGSCHPGPGCIVAGILTKATGKEFHCTM